MLVLLLQVLLIALLLLQTFHLLNYRACGDFFISFAICSSPCLADGMLFVGSRDGILYCFENDRKHTNITWNKMILFAEVFK
jgi:hypothetical protein